MGEDQNESVKNKIVYTTTDIWETSTNLEIEASSKKLLNFRLFWYSACCLHLVVVTIRLLQIDYEAYEDRIKVYKYFRFRLLTIWLNILHLLYNPMALYCDWQEKRGKHRENFNRKLNKLRHFALNSIILPVTCAMDMFFWGVWNRDRELLVPSYCDVIIPYWCQHSLHTFSFVFMVVELLAVPRFRPATLKYHLTALYTFSTLYILVMLETYWSSGRWLYPFLGNFSVIQMILFFAYSTFEYGFYFMLQWCVIDTVWGQRLSGLPDRIKAS